MKDTVLKIEDVLQILKKKKPEFETAYGITDIGIFGSFARGETTPNSDIDIVVKMHPNLLKRACLKAELESIFGKKVDVIRYRNDMNTFLKNRIDNEGLYV